MIEFIRAKSMSDFSKIENLADIIWRKLYIPMVGKPQIDYMLDKFQTAGAIKKLVDQGYEYYKINYNKNTVGYLAILREPEALFLSKIYLLDDFRGKRIGKAAIHFVEEKAESFQLKKIRLTANVNNVIAIKAYESLGFKKNKHLTDVIGNGFIMDDYEMIKQLEILSC